LISEHNKHGNGLDRVLDRKHGAVRKSRLFVGILLGLFCLLAFRLYQRPLFTKQLCDRIEIGMTVKEVNRLLAVPPGKYTTGPKVRGVGGWPMPWDTDICAEGWKSSNFPRLTYKAWMADEGLIAVVFDERGIVRDKWWGPIDSRNPGSILERSIWVLRYLLW
jgi:hypothetical protein